jgi:hypothetical protein
MNLLDETALKAEIQEIADRIDHIIETVNQYHPLKQDGNLSEPHEPGQCS